LRLLHRSQTPFLPLKEGEYWSMYIVFVDDMDGDVYDSLPEAMKAARWALSNDATCVRIEKRMKESK